MLPVITTFSSCPFVTTVCFHLSVFARFLQLPGTKCFLLPTCRQNDFLGVISFSFEYPLTHNSSKSYDFLELLHPTQPKLQSALIIHCCKQLCRTSKSVSVETTLKSALFLAKWSLTLHYHQQPCFSFDWPAVFCTYRGCLRCIFCPT